MTSRGYAGAITARATFKGLANPFGNGDTLLVVYYSPMEATLVSIYANKDAVIVFGTQVANP